MTKYEFKNHDWKKGEKILKQIMKLRKKKHVNAHWSISDNC